ncbi:rhodanese-like domain-containing protein [Bacillus sp. ISL-45]|uniref:rhodanese-like domain-containing protein n=1 Tax=Bacillus sp. ISL-45 TaxID=2819128 RepID=UPI001BE70FE6|nr:rhodanese-like domain-containing protein [Bacillus sp. ISL-45]MBT2662689.1 rhodanese-like domain-containing protein [Bacillus sp. ISL-45]
MKLFGKKALIMFAGAVLAFTGGCGIQEGSTAPQPKVNGQSEQLNVFSVVQQAADAYLKKPAESMAADEIFEKMILNYDPSYFIVDVRDTAAFAAGHIEGSVNIPYNMTANPNQIANLPKDKKILVICYSGHTASQTAALWNMLGYDAISMVNGMGGWTSDANLGTPLPQKPFDFPVETTETIAGNYDLPASASKQYTDETAAILGSADDYLKAGIPPIMKPSDIQESIKNTSTGFMLVDLRPAKEYSAGHLPGAINIAFESLAELEQLKKLSTENKIVLIDHDGTMSSKAARILNMLGYEAYAMKDGMRVWTSNAEINGIMPISNNKAKNYPVKQLNTKLETETGAASCG